MVFKQHICGIFEKLLHDAPRLREKNKEGTPQGSKAPERRTKRAPQSAMTDKPPPLAPYSGSNSLSRSVPCEEVAHELAPFPTVLALSPRSDSSLSTSSRS